MEIWSPSAGWIVGLRSEQLYIFGKDTNELTKEQSFFFFSNLVLTTWMNDCCHGPTLVI